MCYAKAMKTTTIAIVLFVVLAVGAGAWYVETHMPQTADVTATQQPPRNVEAAPVSTSTQPQTKIIDTEVEAIGKSVEGRDVTAEHFGTGEKEILFIGGIHGGYEWNTVMVANQLIDYLREHTEAIPPGLKVTVIPVVNPDGFAKVAESTRFTASDITASTETQISARFNAHNVDLNRNFDCDWQASGTWQNKTVSGGSAAFSEPESQALRAYVEAHKITAAVVWYSSAGGVYASNCHGGVLPETKTILSLYSQASGYPAHENFDYYTVTGDAVNWLAKQNIPAISVLLTNHTDAEWDKNLAGIQALLSHVAQ